MDPAKMSRTGFPSGSVMATAMSCGELATSRAVRCSTLARNSVRDGTWRKTVLVCCRTS